MDPIIGGALVGGAMNLVGKLFQPSMKKQMENQKELNKNAAEINYQYGEKAADNAFERQLGMYDSRLSPEAQMASQMKGLEENGLSVGLMYGGSGPGGSGSASTAPQGSGAGNQQGGSAAAMQANRAQSLAISMEAAKVASEIAVNESIAKKNTTEAEKIGGVDTEMVKTDIAVGLQQIENYKIQRDGQQLQNNYDSIRNEIQSATKELNIQSIQYGVTEQMSRLDRLNREIIGLDLDNQLKQGTLLDNIQIIKNQIANIAIDTALKREQIGLVGAEKDYTEANRAARIRDSVTQWEVAWANLESITGQATLQRNYDEIQKSYDRAQSMANSLIQTAGNLGGASMISKGLTKQTEQKTEYDVEKGIDKNGKGYRVTKNTWNSKYE